MDAQQKRALKKWKVKRTTTTRGEDTIETVELEARVNDPLKGIEFLLRADDHGHAGRAFGQGPRSMTATKGAREENSWP